MKRKSGETKRNASSDEKKKFRGARGTGDPILKQRIKKYMEDTKQKTVLSVTSMADSLQNAYRDYGRKKRAPFRMSVEEAYHSILSSLDDGGGDTYSRQEKKHLMKKQKISAESNSNDSSVDSDSDSDASFSSDNMDYAVHKDTNSMNSFLKDMYLKKCASAPGSIAGVGSNPPSAPGSGASSPRRQDDSDTEPSFCIDRKGDLNIAKKSLGVTTPGSSPRPKSRGGTPTRTLPANSERPKSRGGTPTRTLPSKSERSNSRSGTPTRTLPASNESSKSVVGKPAQTLEPDKPKVVPKIGIADVGDTDDVVIIGDDDEGNIGNQGAKTIIPKDNVQEKKLDSSSTLKETPATVEKKKKEERADAKTAKEDTPAKKRRKTVEKTEGRKGKKSPEVQTSSVRFSDVGGNDNTLKEVCKLLVHMKHPEVYERLGVIPPRGFLLHGPPGCGKTLLAHAIAGELELPFLKVAATELVSGVSGESEEKIRDIFEQACTSAPCVMFIDEIDAITPKRETASKDMERRIVSQLLTCMDDLSTKTQAHVLVIGATNRPDSLDPALRRAGRFDREIGLGIPDEDARQRILAVLCKGLRLREDCDFGRLARGTPGYVGADLMALAREAAMVAVNRVFHDLQSCSLVTSQGRPLETIIEETMTSESVTEDSLNKTSNIPNTISETRAQEVDISTVTVGDNITSQVVTIQGSTPPVEENMTSEGVDTKGVDSNSIAGDAVNNLGESSSLVDQPKPDVAADHSRVVSVSAESNTDGDAEFKLVLSWLKEQPPLTPEQLDSLYIIPDDFQEALKHVQPSAKREGFATIPDVSWDDVGALRGVREELQMAILAPVQHPEHFKALGLTSPPGILLAGPPGCGKTLLAKAIANESGLNFISVKGPELLNMYVGESERAVRQVFQRARNSSPCVIFFDELDALCPRRSDSGEGGSSVRVVNQLLTEMDGLETRKHVFIMGATNRPDIIDPAILRPGRLDKLLYVGLPTPADRLDILNTITKNGTKPVLASDVDLTLVANHSRCEGLTGADLAALVREAAVTALREFMSQSQGSIHSVTVTMMHFEHAFSKIRPSVTAKDQKLYDKLKDRINTDP